MLILSKFEDLQDVAETASALNITPPTLHKETVDFLEQISTEQSNITTLGSSNVLEEIMVMLSSLDIPFGICSMLKELRELPLVEFLIDDSYSMRELTAGGITRWNDALSLAKFLVQIIAFFPPERFLIRFVNRQQIISISKEERAKMTPDVFVGGVHDELDRLAWETPSARYSGTGQSKIFQEIFKTTSINTKKLLLVFAGDLQTSSNDLTNFQYYIEQVLDHSLNQITFVALAAEANFKIVE